MNQCEKCWNPILCMPSDAEIIDAPKDERQVCFVYPNGIPDEFLTDKTPCQFFVAKYA